MFRHGFVVFVLLLAVASAATAQPPSRLHRSGDHWTAWNPPTELPEGAEIHTIVRGDTLWDLAGQYYGNPYLWPQIWEKNPYVLDAHWIYPGDPLVVGIEVTRIEDVQAATLEEPLPSVDEDDAGGLRLDDGVGPPVALGSKDDIYCSGFIGDLDEDFSRRIVGSEYQSLTPTLVAAGGGGSQFGDIDSVKIDLSMGDIVYVNGGSSEGLIPGDLFTIVVPEEKVRHPNTGKVMGRFYSFVGRLRILSVQEESGIAEIVQSCMPTRVGAALMPFEEQPVPLARRTPRVGVNDPASESALDGAPVIVRSEAGVVALGQDHVVYVDRGLADSVTPGDIYTIYRINKKGLPPVVMGELGVLSVYDNSSVARILESRYTVRIGDRLELKSR